MLKKLLDKRVLLLNYVYAKKEFEKRINIILGMKADAYPAKGENLMSQLYDYGISAQLPITCPGKALIRSARTIVELMHVTSDKLDPAWDAILARASARAELDAGEAISVDEMVMLAEVDERTVKNAISKGELQSHKLNGIVYITNTDAKTWLSKRRYFKPTERLPLDYPIFKARAGETIPGTNPPVKWIPPEMLQPRNLS